MTPVAELISEIERYLAAVDVFPGGGLRAALVARGRGGLVPVREQAHNRHESDRVNTFPVAATVALGLLLAGAACGSTRARPVPDVTGEQLGSAEDTLDAAGLRYKAVGGGTFGIVVRSRWTVCRQSPAPKTRAKSVTLFVARSCDEPDVVGMRLDEAEDELEEAGFDVEAHSLDDGPIIVRHFWAVCRQSRADANTVDLFVAHDC